MYVLTAADAAEIRSRYDEGTPDEVIADELATWDENVVYTGRAFAFVESLPAGEVLALAHEIAERPGKVPGYGDFAREIARAVIYRRTLAALQAPPV